MFPPYTPYDRRRCVLTEGTLLPAWPQNPAVSQLQREVCDDAGAVARPKVLEAQVREALVARGFIPAEWLERIYKVSPASSCVGRIRMRHTALLTLAHDPQRATQAERIALEVLAPLDAPIVWVACSSDLYMHLVNSAGVVAPLIAWNLWSGDHGTLAMIQRPEIYAATDADSLCYLYKEANPTWAPLFDLGVMPWPVEFRGRRVVALVCPRGAKPLRFRLAVITP